MPIDGQRSAQARYEVREEVRRKTICGAKAKSTGKPCLAKALANGRCKLHGGMSTGPRTDEGKRRALANLVQYRLG